MIREETLRIHKHSFLSATLILAVLLFHFILFPFIPHLISPSNSLFLSIYKTRSLFFLFIFLPLFQLFLL